VRMANSNNRVLGFSLLFFFIWFARRSGRVGWFAASEIQIDHRVQR
jgi:hypothetical protein